MSTIACKREGGVHRKYISAVRVVGLATQLATQVRVCMYLLGLGKGMGAGNRRASDLPPQKVDISTRTEYFPLRQPPPLSIAFLHSLLIPVLRSPPYLLLTTLKTFPAATNMTWTSLYRLSCIRNIFNPPANPH